jgi:hypothetical protein
MQRARPLRLNAWRLGLLVLAWYALVLQAMLAAPAAMRLAGDPALAAALCLDADRTHQTPGDLPHNTDGCSCTFHCTGTSPAVPTAFATATLLGRTAGEALASAADQFIPIALRDHASARGPPSDTFPVV